MPYGIKRLARTYAVPAITNRYGKAAGAAANLLLAKRPGKAKVSAAQAIKNTNLASYLDKKYEKKCGVEIKQVDNAVTAASTTTTCAALSGGQPFVGIAQGLTDSTRIGNTIEVKSCKFKVNFYAGAASTGVTNVRIIVCKQSQMQLAALTGAALLQDPTNIRSPLIMDKQRSFSVIKDFTFKLAAFSSGDAASSKSWTWTYRPKHCHSIKWTQADTTGVIGNMLEGNLIVMVFHEQSGAVSVPSYNLYTRAEWTDV